MTFIKGALMFENHFPICLLDYQSLYNKNRLKINWLATFFLGPSIKTEHAQVLKVLQLLALKAGQTNARQFIQMLFRTSVGKTMPDTNKVPTPLLKDVAMASGHDDVAQNLQDVNTR